ncbi:MAG: PQQ-like beta-propeller repeat protein, partial [Holosporales bacterium]|nr:PQQ-like beta-propeller repeat protein [Holosporales bacterium]
MMRRVHLPILTAVVLLAACDKKEILTGQRDEIPGVTAVDNTNPVGVAAVGAVNLTAPTVSSGYVDVSYNKQRNSPNHKTGKLNKLVWKSSLGRGPISSNIVAVGTSVFCINANGKLVCLSQKDGRQLWEKDVAPQPDEALFSGGMTANGEILYITTNVCAVLAIDTKTQNILWKRDIKYPLKGAPLYVAGKVIVTSVENHTYAINAKSGDIEWTMMASGEQTMMASSGTPAVYGDSVICPYSSGEIKSYNIHTGLLNWEDELVQTDVSKSGSTISHIVAPPVVFGRYALAATPESKMVLYDVISGAAVWERDVGVIYPPIENSGSLFVLSEAGALLCLATNNGAVRWRLDVKKIELEDDNTKSEDLQLFGPLLMNGN